MNEEDIRKKVKSSIRIYLQQKMNTWIQSEKQSAPQAATPVGGQPPAGQIAVPGSNA